MSFSKSIRKKRRHSRKRNMRGGVVNGIATLSYNPSFVYSFHKLFPFPASENTSLYLRLEILYTQALAQGIIPKSTTLQEFVNTNFGIFFPMSCKIIGKFFEEHGTYGYCAAALQEMNLTKYYHDIMLTNTNGQVILANGVIFNRTVPGIGYVIQNTELEKYIDKRTTTGEAVVVNSFASIYYDGDSVTDEVRSFDVYSNFNVRKVAIQDLGDQPEYASAPFLGTHPTEPQDIIDGLFVRIIVDKEGKRTGLLDGGRPMALIVKHEEGGKHIFHFNCHVPNPSALKKYPFDKSILENYLGQKVLNDPESIATRDMDQWVEITLAVMKKCGRLLLNNFFNDTELGEILSNIDNYTILFSGDFNDGTGKLLNSINTNGLDFGYGKMTVHFPPAPKGCCANLNSVQESPWGTASPPGMVLTKLDPTTNTNTILVDLLTRENKDKNSFIVNPNNFAFPGDITGSTTRLTADVYKPIIQPNIVINGSKLDIDYNGLVEKFLHPSDHMPVVSTTIDKRTIGTIDHETIEPKRQNSVKDPEVLPELEGGYRKKRRSQRKLKQRKSKRHTKKRNYKKNKN